MKNAMMHLIIVFILLITLIIYVYWAQQDDFCFYTIFALLLVVLYILVNNKNPKWIRENFEEQTQTQDNGGNGSINLNAFAALGNLKHDASKILRPSFANLIASFRGSAVIDEADYDEEGKEIEKVQADEVTVDAAKEPEIRAVNMVLRDLKKFEPGYFYGLLALSQGTNLAAVREEYVIS